MSELVKLDTMSLSAIAGEINAIYSNVENGHMRTALLYAQASRKFKSKYPELSDAKVNSKFIEWASTETPYRANTIYGYLSVEEKFFHRKKSIKKDIPFNVLRDLSSPKVDKKTSDAVFKKYENKKPPTREAVREIIKKAQPPKPSKPAPNINPDFAERSKRSGSYVANAGYLLEVIPSCSAETVRILAKHWKHKYHPDKGGDPDIFDRIVKAEQQLLKERGEV